MFKKESSMAEARRFSPNKELDVGQILSDARNRWLRPPEICHILQNYEKLQISPEPPTTPASGSVFLFDRKVLRFFRKDGHNWRKKRDGKTVNEAHERLKVGSVDVLHCFYAHGHENANFQRRSYWMLQEELSHVVFVHYLEVKGSRVWTSYNRMQTADSAHFSHETGEVFTGESAYNQQGNGNSIVHSYQQPASTGFDPYNQMSFTPRDSYQTNRVPIITVSSSIINGPCATNGLRNKKSLASLTWRELLNGKSDYEAEEGLPLQPNSEHGVLSHILEASSFTMQDFAGIQESMLKSEDQELNGISSLASSEKAPYLSTMKQHLLDGALGEEGLKKVDSFSCWMSKELGEVEDVGVIADTNESFTHSSSTAYWEEVNVISPSLSGEQLFSIIDFAPDWTYVGSQVNVHVTGKFLKTRKEAETGEWSCMFGQTEVPADVIADGILQCVAPMHEAGRVPFYVTCSNRLACSEVREFEYKVLESQAFGRETDESTVIGSLIALGASPGNLTDPNPDFPSGSTPSDLTYANGYKGIAGYLSEYALTAHVSLLSLDEINAAVADGTLILNSSSLTDSLTAVPNATQAANRIHQVSKAQSFQKKQQKEFGDRKFGMSEERALSMHSDDDSVQAAAIRIQNKFRGYKGRKDYLITRQRIIKIQAHVRGYQIRQDYRKIIWSVGILEKMQDGTEKEEDDDDFFKQGRKETEEGLQKALARVKSMAEYPEARDQYRRLLNVLNNIQESKALENSEGALLGDDDLIDIEALLGDDDNTLMMPMSSTFWNT